MEINSRSRGIRDIGGGIWLAPHGWVEALPTIGQALQSLQFSRGVRKSEPILKLNRKQKENKLLSDILAVFVVRENDFDELVVVQEPILVDKFVDKGIQKPKVYLS
jgi:hypothetical protein